jgi:protein-tyrosine phosphatase
MFGLFKKKEKQSSFTGNYSGLHTDMHSHLLPGIDDGSPDVDTSIELIKGMMELGFKKFITTPHVYPDLYPNTTASIQQAHAVLTQRLQQEQMDVEVKAAAEYFIDEQFPERIDRREQLLTIHQNWVLVEISFISPPVDLNETIFNGRCRLSTCVGTPGTLQFLSSQQRSVSAVQRPWLHAADQLIIAIGLLRKISPGNSTYAGS